MGLDIVKLDIAYCTDIAEILNSDNRLHMALTPNCPHKETAGQEYFDKCMAWESRKNGCNFIIINNGKPIGSISYCEKNYKIAGCGYWIKSNLWGNGYGTEAFSMFLPIIKNAGYKYVTASILKENEASLKIWAKYTTDIKESENRYIPTIKLS